MQICDVLGPVARSRVSANRWLRGIKTNRFSWYLTFKFTIERLSCDLEKINVKTDRKQKCKAFHWLIEQKQTSANFHWLSEHGCKQRHLSMELSGKFPFDVI